MAAFEVPDWAVRLRDERKARLWSQKSMAVRLINAADDRTRKSLPSVESVQRYVRGWENGDHRPSDLYASLYCRIFGLTHEALFGEAGKTGQSDQARSSTPTLNDAAGLISWLSSTNTSREALDHLTERSLILADNHTQMPASKALREVTQLHDQAQGLLRSGRQKLHQTRELYKLDADLLAHASVLLGDLNQDRTAMALGRAALMCTQEAATNEAAAWAAMSKTARWQGKYQESAEFARRGFESSSPSPLRAMLASYEARAAGLLGDVHHAREALARAEAAAEALDEPGTGVSVWSFSRPRQALLTISVTTRIGEPDASLRAVAAADAAWQAGLARSPGTWAQIRVGAGIAYLMRGELDGTMNEVTAMLDLAPEFRMATVTRYLDDLAARLRQRKFRNSRDASELLARIEEFNASALLANSQEEA
ncbi:multiprotein-bridging factor 1 family protein [Actinomadura sp. 1N219]|uniref:multiprotein-bridging factor 1 family protein n=1 Tax=Actinomadura sp. 1N219 TaxID=3375152 RepID=UPI00378FE361